MSPPHRPAAPAPAVEPPVPLPEGLALGLDPGVRRIEGGTVLVGGAPLRLLRLTAAGARIVDRIDAGEPVPPGAAATRLARRLLDGGLAHPCVDAVVPPHGPGDVAVVIPVRDRAAGLARTLACLTRDDVAPGSRRAPARAPTGDDRRWPSGDPHGSSRPAEVARPTRPARSPDRTAKPARPSRPRGVGRRRQG